MIRNVVLHLTNEQPLLADLFVMPTTADTQLVCTNLRSMNGKRPVFADDEESTFVFPIGQVRFVEVPVGAEDGSEARPKKAGPMAAESNGRGSAVAGLEGEDEIDEDFLRRVREA